MNDTGNNQLASSNYAENGSKSNPLKIGVIGTGWIAEKLAMTIHAMPEFETYAIASRNLSRAQAFADRRLFARAYGSYEEMLDDEEVGLVYIASPHSHHYEHALACIRKGKPVLCEKAFTATAPQAREVLELAREKKVFITEAIWTRYMPLSKKINELIASGVIGSPHMVTANLCYPISHKERIMQADLAGGALLDIGIYPINFASMILGPDVKKVVSTCQLTHTGMDAQESITLLYDDNRMACLQSSIWVKSDRQGIVSGTEGHLIVENCNNPQKVTVVDLDYKTVAEYDAPHQISGYEYQLYACKEAIENGWIEHPDMPHAEILRIMQLFDDLRKEWGVRYPWDNW